MKYLSKRFASILLSFAFFAASLVVYANLIQPTYDNIKVEQGKLIAAQQKNSEYTNVFTRLKQVSTNFQQSPELQNRVSMAFPLDANVSDSMNQISAVALANGLTIASIDITSAPVIPTVTKKAGDISFIKGTGVLKNAIVVAGTYEEIKAFLQGVETGVRIANIKLVRLTRSANPATPEIINASVEIETYYQAK
ncbi:MAG: hypothetical protein ACD_81C00088G0002 [uncultured bacterium]|uniref:Pilus assembly protein, PilO n=1 Tax=Candidatus Wolfebacteria bacterium GW2011_GWE2_44_13 TaxID=1619017 RepID=A0A0G1HA72_9BACT|nr:MAG: hypothetical protein ACD_81C00088G0002 [uncultured bacterium]KKT43650.1 MAG: hypothetical protein UW32_C0001G0242 [Candidatus Wolfebacteria bacterium GW2011_GWE2_44_13]